MHFWGFGVLGFRGSVGGPGDCNATLRNTVRPGEVELIEPEL